MLDTSRMTPEEKKKFDFEIASGMRDRKTGELLPQFVEGAPIPTAEDTGDEGPNLPSTSAEPKKRTRKTKE